MKKFTKKKKIILVGCLALAAALTAYGIYKSNEKVPEVDNDSSDASYGTEQPLDEPDDEKIEIPELKAQWSEFDDSLVEYLRSNGYYDSNFVVSPASFRVLLCLAAEGAKGETQTQLVGAAGFEDIVQFQQWCELFQTNAIIRAAQLAAKKDEFGMEGSAFASCASIWNNKDVQGELAYPYKSYVEERLRAQAYACEADALAEELDKWIAEKTQGGIPETGKDVTGASCVLAGGVYLEPLWQEGLEIGACDGVFTGTDGVERGVRFLELKGEFLYADKNGTQILVLPMEGGMSFVCFFGNRADMFDKLSELKQETVHVMIPEFDTRSLFDAGDLLNYLINRGDSAALVGADADFGGISENADWFLQEIIQTSEVRVLAGGSEGGYDTDEDMKEFKADSPFSYAVFADIGTQKQQVLLYGQMMTADQ